MTVQTVFDSDTERQVIEAVFHRQTGLLPPGADVPAAKAAGYMLLEDRRAAFAWWCQQYRPTVIATIRTLDELDLLPGPPASSAQG